MVCYTSGMKGRTMKKPKPKYAKGGPLLYEKTEVLKEMLENAVGSLKLEIETILAGRKEWAKRKAGK